jgi:subtilisin family serine protease
MVTACSDLSTAVSDRQLPSAEAVWPQLDKRGVHAPPRHAAEDIVPGHYNVVFRPEADTRALMAVMRNVYGLVPSHEWDEPWIRGFSARMDDAQIEKVKNHAGVVFVNPVVRGRAVGTQYPYNWGLDRIDQRWLPMNDLYVYSDSAPNVNVYVVDSGLNYDNWEFEGRARLGIDVATPGGRGRDCNGHGTTVGSIVGGWDYGVAKKAQLYSVRVIGCDNQVYSNNLITGVNWVTNNHVTPAVANLSVEFFGVVPELDQAIYASVQAGVTWVVAAGNSGLDACGFTPSHTLGTISVGATDSLDYRAEFSNFGPCVDLFAPGVDIEAGAGPMPYSFDIVSGTSFSAPHVAGIAAMYLSRYPKSTPQEVKAALLSNATTGVVSNVGTGSPNRLVYSQF